MTNFIRYFIGGLLFMVVCMIITAYIITSPLFFIIDPDNATNCKKETNNDDEDELDDEDEIDLEYDDYDEDFDDEI